MLPRRPSSSGAAGSAVGVQIVPVLASSEVTDLHTRLEFAGGPADSSLVCRSVTSLDASTGTICTPTADPAAPELLGRRGNISVARPTGGGSTNREEVRRAAGGGEGRSDVCSADLRVERGHGPAYEAGVRGRAGGLQPRMQVRDLARREHRDDLHANGGSRVA